ncbi:MAG: FAD-binding oxidoreductase [Actinobacteria bacterium]|nr:FAD-binding oxidoreductase [Actinomycetota bacterium]
MVDVVVAGAGPLGASVAYHLARRGMAVTVATADDAPASYRSSGGSVCWHRPDPRHAAAIEETATFVRDAVAAGAAIDCRAVPYLFVHKGVMAPALNISSPDLVAHLLHEARTSGTSMVDIGHIAAVEQDDDGYTVLGGSAAVSGRAVVLALGVGNIGVMPGLHGAVEKRQLFVLDLPVDDDRARWPHTIVRIADGYAYVFVKRFSRGLRVVVGHEDLVEDDDKTGAVDYFADLLNAGVGERFPWLRGAQVEQVLWGLDWAATKRPHIATDDAGLFSVNAGSAVRVCIPAGRQLADRVAETLQAAA